MNRKRQDIVNFIAEIRNSHSEMTNIFSYGSCLNFYFILRRVWPEAKPYFNIDHVVTKIDDRYYDINGDITLKVRRSWWTSLFDIYPYEGTKRSIKRMARAEHRITKHEDESSKGS